MRHALKSQHCCRGGGKVGRWESWKVGKWGTRLFSLSHFLTVPLSLPPLRPCAPFLHLIVITVFAANSLFAAAPQITSPPQPRNVIEGASYNFQVTAAGTAPLAFQWRRDGAALPAATNSLLALAGIQTNQAGLYTVAIANAEGAFTSAPVRLTVRATNDPAYPTPHAGWSYLYAGNAIASSQTAGLDGTWNHESDSWSGDGRGPGNGLPGGLSTSSGILTIEDAVTTTTGGTFNNRRFQFTHNIAQEAPRRIPDRDPKEDWPRQGQITFEVRGCLATSLPHYLAACVHVYMCTCVFVYLDGIVWDGNSVGWDSVGWE